MASAVSRKKKFFFLSHKGEEEEVIFFENQGVTEAPGRLGSQKVKNFDENASFSEREEEGLFATVRKYAFATTVQAYHLLQNKCLDGSR